MSKNDIILLDNILESQTKESPYDSIGEMFEYFVYSQMQKNYGITQEEILNGVVDGSLDGGIDAIYTYVNGDLLVDLESFYWPRVCSELEINIYTCKHYEHFKMETINCMHSSILEFFDFTKADNELITNFNEEILLKRKEIIEAYNRASLNLNSFSINLFYARRGDEDDVSTDIKAKGDLLVEKLKLMFPNSYVNFYYVGRQTLINKYRKKENYNIRLKFDSIITYDNSYIILANLKNYYDFVTEENELKRYLFNSNVRDFLGNNRVNSDIFQTLENKESPDFWWLNNGVTILATRGIVIGKELDLENVQIVNGLQTTQSLYSFYKNNTANLLNENRNILVKIIISTEKIIQDLIIKSTNNQTVVQGSSFFATDKIQMDIEDILIKNNLYYERREKYYINQNHDINSIVTPLYIASGYLNLVLKNPWRAATLKSRVLREPASYDKVFNKEVSLNIWPVIAKIMKKTDAFLDKKRFENINTEKFLKYSRQLVSFLTISRISKTFNFNINYLLNFEMDKYNEKELEKTWDFIQSNVDLKVKNVRSLSKKFVIIEICERHAKKYNIQDIEKIAKNRDTLKKKMKTRDDILYVITDDFLEDVDKALPSQPWPTRVQNAVAEALDCPPGKVKKAIKVLIKQGRKFNQVNGELFDLDGNKVENKQ